jgi:hypothetical protein
MRKQEMVSGYVRFSRGVPSGAVFTKGRGATLWWQHAGVKATYSVDVGLVDGDPMLHPIPKALEAGVRICSVIISASQHNRIN